MTAAFPYLEAASAVSIIKEKLQTNSPPLVAEQVANWMDSLSPTASAADYFTQRSIYPMLYVPNWMAEAAGLAWNSQLQSDLVYSTINGYYFVRMIDNLVDGDATVEKRLLPMSAFFHFEFQSVYHRYFEASHPFWQQFLSIWLKSAAVVLQEAVSHDMDLAGFCEIAANKLSAIKIPLVALHYHCNEKTDLRSWLRFSEQLAEWWQLFDDLMDWHKDHARGTCTYFLCEGRKRKQPYESLHHWVAREGFQWAIETLIEWMYRMQDFACAHHLDGAIGFLKDRATMLHEMSDQLSPGMKVLDELAIAMELNVSESHSL